MKIAFKVIKTKSGGNVYFDILKNQIKDSKIILYPKLFEIFPLLLKLVNKKTDAKIIHSVAEYGWIFREKDKPLVVTIHHNVFDPDYRKTASWLQKGYHSLIIKPNMKKTLKSASKIIAVSEYTKNSIIKTFGNYPIIMIYNGVDTEKFKPIKIKSDDKRFKLLFVGNLIRRKGVDILPKIMKKLGENYVLYYTSGLKTKIPKNFNLPNMISLGKLSDGDLVKEYNKCDVLLFPTRLEGFGYSVAESMACGKPVIATNCSSIPELVEDGKNGFLCKMDEIDDFVDKVKKLKKNKSLYKKMSKKNRNKIVNNFSLVKMNKYYKKLYNF